MTQIEIECNMATDSQIRQYEIEEEYYNQNKQDWLKKEPTSRGCITCVNGGRIYGILLFQASGASWRSVAISLIHVNQQYRKNHLASTMIDFLKDIQKTQIANENTIAGNGYPDQMIISVVNNDISEKLHIREGFVRIVNSALPTDVKKKSVQASVMAMLMTGETNLISMVWM
jgi:hypothetical protein